MEGGCYVLVNGQRVRADETGKPLSAKVVKQVENEQADIADVEPTDGENE